MQGFSLITVVIISSVTALLGIAGLIMSKTGYEIISAEEKHYIAEEKAEAGLNLAVKKILDGEKCEDLNNSSLGGAEIYTKKAGGSCFLYSKGEFRGAEAIKVGIVFAGNNDTFYGALVSKQISNLNVLGTIKSCDEECKVPAVVTESDINENNFSIGSCDADNGIIAQDIPIADNASLGDLAEVYFNLDGTTGNTGREKLISKLSQEFGIEFDDNGTPVGLLGNVEEITDSNGNLLSVSGTFEICKAYFNSCEAYKEDKKGEDDEYVISCNNNNIKFIWNEYKNAYQVEGTSIYCKSLDLGENSTLRIQKLEVEIEDEGETYKNFPRIIVQNATFFYNKDISENDEDDLEIENIILVVKESFTAYIPDQAEELELENSFIFGKNFTFEITGSDKKFKVEKTLIYSGGSGVGNLSISLKGDTEFGEDDEPILLISDNNTTINIQGDSEIHGVLYATSQVNNLNVNISGNVKWKGSIVSNSKNNNNIDINDNATLEFEKETLSKLHEFLDFFNEPKCEQENKNVNVNLIHTKMSIY